LPTAAGAADTTSPTQPGTVTVSAVTATSAKLAWARSTDNVGVEGYRVYRGPAAAAVTSLALIATTDAVPSYSATKLRSGTAYKFGIMAIDPANNKSVVRTVTVTTAASSDTTAPLPPSSSSVSAKPFSSSRIDVVWAASTSTDVSGYQVLRDGAVVGQVDLPGGLRYSDNGLAAVSTHNYAIKAIDSAGNLSAATTGRSAQTLSSGFPIIARGPFTSNVTGTSAIVSWWTNIPTTGVVGYGLQSSTEHTVTDPAGSVQQHKVALAGLSPNARYVFSVTSGSASATGAFPTAAATSATFAFAAIGDFGGASPGEAQNANNIATSDAAFIQTVGDNIYPSSGLPDPNFSTTLSDFDSRFFKQFGPALTSRPFFPANGNQEYFGDGAFWNVFPMLGTNHSWYAYDWGAAHILVLDGEQPVTVGSPQYNFAQSDLAGHQSSRWRIVVIQKPPYSSSTSTSSSMPVRQNLVPLFDQNRVALVLSGNSHNYERSFPMSGGAVVTTGGTTYLVTGAGGNGFNTFSLAQPGTTAFREATYYQYAKVTVSPTGLRVDGIRADTNSVFDTVTIP
jgi:hypothetical protein